MLRQCPGRVAPPALRADAGAQPPHRGVPEQILPAAAAELRGTPGGSGQRDSEDEPPYGRGE